MPDVIENLESQPDASTSSDPEVRYADDKSVDTGAETPAEPVEVETETEEVVEEPKSEADPSPADEENVDETIDALPDDPEFSGVVKERIDKLTTNWRETERSLEARNREVAELREKLSERPVQQEPLKTLEDFEFDDPKYQTYLMEESERRSAAAAERAVLEVQDRKATEDREQKFSEAENGFAEKHDDYFEVTRNPNLRMSKQMLNAAAESDIRTDLLYHLAKNPDKAERIFKLSDAAAGFEMGLLHTSLKSEMAKVAAPKKVSNAPKPVPKIKSGDAGLEKGYVTTMTDSQFRKRREKEIANR